MDHIAFRVVETQYDSDPVGVAETAVELLVNGIRLAQMWEDAGGSATTPLWLSDAFAGGRPLWGDRHATADAQFWWPIDGGRVPVLTCTCGCFPCGGASALIEYGSDAVSWSDFHEALPTNAAVALGPFRFAREEYEAALASIKPARR